MIEPNEYLDTKPSPEYKYWALCFVLGASFAFSVMSFIDGGSGHHHGGVSSKTKVPDSPATASYRQANDTMHQAMNIAFTGNADADFLNGMIPHHQGAVDMAKVVIDFGKDAKVKALAQSIITAQEKEIKDMRTWQAELGLAPAVLAKTKVSSPHH